MTFLMCDPGWYVHNPDVQIGRDENRHTYTHTHTHLENKVLGTKGGKSKL